MRSGASWPPPSWGVHALLSRYPGLAFRPSRVAGTLVIAGELTFSASEPGRKRPVEDTFLVEIQVSRNFPNEPPLVRDAGGRVPRTFHTNPDGTLCLGSPIAVRMRLAAQPDLVGFVETSVIPYLYAFVRKERGEPLPFGELAHGDRGLLDDYRRLLGTRDDRTCVALLMLLGMKKRIANKQRCACGSGRRVGRCHHRALNRLRPAAPRSWFRAHATSLGRRYAQRQRKPAGMRGGSVRRHVLSTPL